MDAALLIGLILLNGVLAMSEIAVVSSRQARLVKLAEDGNTGARSALALNREPSIFLSTVQVGITMVGILSGAIGEATLAVPLAEWLGQFPSIADHAMGIAMTTVVGVLTYLSVVVGELVPKQLGLLAPERVAARIARPMNLLSRMAGPLVLLLSSSSSLLLFLLGVRRPHEPSISDDEIKLLMEQGAEAGVFHASERAIVANVLRLDQQWIGSIMTPRKDIYLLDLNDDEAEIRRRLAESPYKRVVVCRGGLDNIVGVLRTGDLLQMALFAAPLAVEPFVRAALYVPPAPRSPSCSKPSVVRASSALWQSTNTASWRDWSRSPTCSLRSSATCQTRTFPKSVPLSFAKTDRGWPTGTSASNASSLLSGSTGNCRARGKTPSPPSAAS